MARYVTVGSISHRPEVPPDQVEARLAQAEQFAVRAARMGADIIAFPEIYLQLGISGEEWPTHAEPLDGPSCQRMAKVAREHGMYIIWPLIERDGDALYNSCALLDRSGKVAGVYHKMFPTIGEIESSIRPGTGPNVFQTDFGKIGIAICFDLNFPEAIEAIGKEGADILFFSSMYRGGLQLQSWALLLRLYAVSAIAAELGLIVDMSGHVLAEATYEAVITRRLNLDRRILHMDYNWQKMDEMLAKYGPDIHFDYFTREATYAISSEREGLSVDDLIAEFGLEKHEDYFARARAARHKALRLPS